MTNNFVFQPDLATKKIHIGREFNAPIEKVWRAWTEAALLEKWVAPKPWKVVFKTFDFTVGGISLYAMIGPEGQKHWVYDEFTAIEPGSSFSQMGVFCDQDGNPATEGPKSYNDRKFSTIDGNRTLVASVLTFEDEATIQWFVEGGFKEGTIMSFDQLDELLSAE